MSFENICLFFNELLGYVIYVQHLFVQTISRSYHITLHYKRQVNFCQLILKWFIHELMKYKYLFIIYTFSDTQCMILKKNYEQFLNLGPAILQIVALTVLREFVSWISRSWHVWFGRSKATWMVNVWWRAWRCSELVVELLEVFKSRFFWFFWYRYT